MVESDFLLGPVAGTILSLPLFDGGQRKAGVAQAERLMRKASPTIDKLY